VADNESDIEPDNIVEDSECPEKRNMCAAPNVPGLIRPMGRSKTQPEKGLVTVNAPETRRISGNRNM